MAVNATASVSKKISGKKSVASAGVVKPVAKAGEILKTATEGKKKKASRESKVISESSTLSPLKNSVADSPRVPKQTREEVAASKKAERERNELLYRITSVLVPMHFGNSNVEKVFKAQQLRPETAISLMFIGSRPEGMCETSIAMNLRGSGFGRREAMLIPYMGMSSMIGSKLGKWAKKQNPDATEDERSLEKMVLTAKGKKIFDITKRSVLSPWVPQHSYL
ncbi:hypothetical protein [Rhodoferax ferrireducens]|uniref:hypothetical protein n=1 Tax=Rhodoferax ferrireducens TaxID=192843 RepID=UPI001300A56D|nr:hypothetical protein [Rhodoferax ferrireducens]